MRLVVTSEQTAALKKLMSLMGGFGGIIQLHVLSGNFYRQYNSSSHFLLVIVHHCHDVWKSNK